MKLSRRCIAGRRRLTWSLALTLALTLAGCADMGHIAPQAQRLAAGQLAAGQAIRSAAPIAWPTQAWWQDLHDPQLDALLRAALADSPTLRVAAARLRQANALAGLAQQASEPKVDLNAAANRERYSADGTTPKPLAGNWAWRNQATLNGTYDLDLWGKHRAALAAALDEVHLAAAEAQVARLSLETALVRSYIQLAYQFTLRDSLRASLEQHQRILEITRKLQRAGLATELGVAQLETALPASQRALEQSDEAITLLRNQLAALGGQGPGAGAALTRPTLQLERAPGLPSALPAELVSRRPDLAAQRWRVEAATQHIDMAKADFYPNLNLIAFAGLQSFGFEHFLDPQSRIAGVAPAVTLPVFAGARLRAQLGVQAALYDVAVEQYNGVLVQSLAEVANAISSAQSLGRQYQLGQQSLASARRARGLAEQAYRSGVTDSLNVLSAQVTLLGEQQQMAQIVARQLDGYVALMAALGGGVGDVGKVGAVGAAGAVSAAGKVDAPGAVGAVGKVGAPGGARAAAAVVAAAGAR